MINMVLCYSHFQIINSKAQMNYAKAFDKSIFDVLNLYFDASTSNKLSIYKAKIIFFFANTLKSALIKQNHN